jgi:uncharacterized protein (TIRG00374 family)
MSGPDNHYHFHGLFAPFRALSQSFRGNWRRIIPGLLISALSLVVILYLVDLDRMIDALRMANYRFVALMLFATLVWLLVRTVVWRTLLQEQATYKQVFLTVNEGYLLNNVLPFRLGEVGRAFLLGRKADLEFMRVFSTILIERALDVAFSAGLLLSTLSFVVGAAWASQAAIIAGSLVLVGLAVLYLLARYRDWTQNQLERIAPHWAFLQGLLHKQIPAFFAGLGALTDGKRFLRVIFWVALNWIIAVIQFYVILLAFFPQSRLLWAAFTLGVVTLGIAAPSSPGAIGVLELAMVGALSVFDLDPSTALAAALTAHMANYLITGIIGVYALAQDGLTLTGVYKNVQDISPGQT